MIIEEIAKLLFYGFSGLIGLYSIIMIYVLLAYGRSRVLGLALSAFYVLLIVSIYSSAVGQFLRITFPEFTL